MAYAILRTQKLKHLASVRRSLTHSFRAQDTPNADPSRTPDNTHIGASGVADGMAKIEAKLPEKRRKDAVLAIEYLVTASPEAMAGRSRADQDAYLQDALAWLKARHGAENVVYAGIHRDETTPHLYAYVVPLDEKGKLNAKKWLGGAKALGQMQTDFANQVGAKHGLERGIENSKAKHQAIRDWYSQVNQEVQEATISPEAVQPKVLKKGILSSTVESPEMIAARLTKEVREIYAPAVSQARTAASDRRRAHSATKEVSGLQTALRELQEAVKPFLNLRTLARTEFEALAKLAQEKLSTRLSRSRGSRL
jgi:hypothetical protein